jgi:hypothetical protein
MFSIYTSAFNVNKMAFEWQDALNNFARFADEVVIAVNTSDDNTFDDITNYLLTDSSYLALKVKVVQTDFKYDDPDLDGKIKNAALQETTHLYKIGLDLDERIRIQDQGTFRNLTSYFHYDKADAVLIPVLNLYQDDKHYKDIGQKWYLHRTGLYRGTVQNAKRKDGTHDISVSDSCELLDKQGNLVRSLMLIDPNLPPQMKLEIMKQHQLPFIVHYGYIDLAKRIHRNQIFWADHWNLESGSEADVPRTIGDLPQVQIFEHNLLI